MRKNSSVEYARPLGLALSTILASAAWSAPAPAQSAPQDQSTRTATTEDESDVIVTGSRIARPNDISAVPITSLSNAELTDTGRTAIGDQINDLPSVRSSFSQQNSSRFLGTTGLNLIDLRGLGPQRTLVLVNGRRHVGGDILSSGVSTDVNTIPADLIDRVDIVTGGESATYGSDAIAGVVNFILKDRYDGLAVKAQGGISDKGDAGAYKLSLLAGHNFADDRGNLAVNLEYTRQNDFYASERDDLRKPSGFVVVDSDPASSPNGSDGIPDRRLFTDIRQSTVSSGGQLSFASPTGACGRDVTGAPYNCFFIFQPDGSLVPQTGTRVGLAPAGSVIGGNASTGREGQIVSLLPRNETYSANLVGHFEVSPAFIPFVEATYMRSNTLRSVSGPTFIQGTTFSSFGGDARERPRLDNPYLTASARAIIVAQLTAAGAPATPTSRFSLRENLVGLGLRQEDARRETYRIVGGVRGTFNDDWRYELSANYGEFSESTRVLGNTNVQRFLLAADAAVNGAGQIVCRSQIDPAARIALAGNAVAAAQLAADVANCVPINLFGEGNISAAARNYINQDTISRGKISQLDVSGFVSGDTSGFLRLPGGPIGFAIGGEYRRETNFFQEDPNVEAGLTFYNAIPTFTSPAFKVKEGFGELRLPLLKDFVIAKELTVTAAGRVSDYAGATGTVFAYNFGAEYAPVEDIRFRANYSRSVRAPNVGESFAVQGQNFATVTDPCSARNLGQGTGTRAANCAAAGRPTGATTITPQGVVATPNGYDFVYAQSLSVISGGNPNLTEETSDSYTYGAVLTPRFLPGFALSVDYYNIQVKNVISSLSAQQVLNNCYDSANLSNVFCTLFQRNTSAGLGPSGEQPFQVLENSLLESSANFAKLRVRGIDVDLSYRHRFAFGELSSHLVYTHALESNQFVDPTNPDYRDQLLGELGDPKDAFNWNFNLKRNGIDIGYQLRYIGPMTTDFYEDLYSVNGLPPQNADFSDPLFYPSVFYHNIRIGVDVNERFNVYFGMDNVADQKPPLGSTGIGSNIANGVGGIGGGAGIYDNRGRYLYAGVTARF